MTEKTLESKNFILGKKGYMKLLMLLIRQQNINFKEEAEYSKDFVNGVIFLMVISIQIISLEIKLLP